MSRSRRVRRRDDGSERDRSRPRHFGDEQPRDDGDNLEDFHRLSKPSAG
jgi:hypothetical protein